MNSFKKIIVYIVTVVSRTRLYRILQKTPRYALWWYTLLFIAFVSFVLLLVLPGIFGFSYKKKFISNDSGTAKKTISVDVQKIVNIQKKRSANLKHFESETPAIVDPGR